MALIFLGAMAVGADATEEPASTQNPWTMCAKATNRIERQEGIPRQLLRAISKTESGRFHAGKQVVMAWPWTVMAEGRGRYLETKAEAIAEVEALQARGVKNIDVGCMQVNLQHHPGAFASLEEAFDPLTNVTYAAWFLKTLAAEQGSWAKAAAYYHSQNPARYRGYRSKVREIWAEEREKYLLALDQLRAEQTAALGLASLSGVDAPLPATTLAQMDDADPLRPLDRLAFGRAGPVRPQVSTLSQVAER
jgi:soluble lytic murein transglycosylase-like protein